MKFEDLEISPQIIKAIYEMGFEEPTPIQQSSIPPALERKDIIGQAQTGTGKTAAFAIPVLETIKRGKRPRVIILEPTRELAIQVSEEFNKIGKYKKLYTLPVFGGQSIDRQIKALQRGVDIVVGTPGRVIDHIERKTLKLEKITTVILDEADEMLDMGFIEDIEKILKHIPDKRQTMLFSATIDKDVMRISKKYMDEPVKVTVSVADIVVPKIRQIFYEVWEDEKLDALSKVIDVEDPYRCLVFCHTKRDVDHVASKLREMGYNADAIHGDYSQFQRNSVMRKFKDGEIDILVATDVAARGLDIQDVTHVVNYSIPQNPESYVHRIGRTGRAGKSGIAILFITPKEYRQLRLIEKSAKTKISKAKLPTPQEVVRARKVAIQEDIVETIEGRDYSSFLPLADKILSEHEPNVALAAVMSLAFEDITMPQEVHGMKHGAMTRLFMTTGRKDGITPKDIVKVMREEADVPFKEIGKIALMESFTFVEVSKEYADRIIYSLDRLLLKGKKVRVEKARGKRDR